MQDKINKVFKAIADPTRREILHALVVASVALPITQIADQFQISRQGVTKHIKTLEGAGLVNVNKNGREKMVFANLKPLKGVQDWLSLYDQLWDEELKDLSNYLDQKT